MSSKKQDIKDNKKRKSQPGPNLPPLQSIVFIRLYFNNVNFIDILLGRQSPHSAKLTELLLSLVGWHLNTFIAVQGPV